MSDTRVLTVSLETVTPMFLGGADNRSPELRSPPFRGVMRYWFRALAGGVVGDDLNALKEAETKVFGSTDIASPVVVRVEGKWSYFDLEQRADRMSGYNYLYWSLFLQDKDKKPRGIAPGSTFEVSLTLRPNLHQDQVLWQAGAALWLLVHLSGIGSRSRRTLGSLVAKEEVDLDSDAPLPQFVSKVKDIDSLATELQAGIQKLRRIVSNHDGKTASMFNVLHKERCMIWVVGDKWHTWEEAAESLGSALRSLRQSLPIQQRAALGLPLKGLKKPPYPRYASPLMLKLTPLNDGSIAGVVVAFHPLVGSIKDFEQVLVRPFVQNFRVRKEISL